MPYSLANIQKTLAEEYGLRVSRPDLKTALEKPQFVPDIDRMVAVSNRLANLPTSTKYGVFKGMSGSEYELEGGSKWGHARLLTMAEIAKCF